MSLAFNVPSSSLLCGQPGALELVTRLPRSPRSSDSFRQGLKNFFSRFTSTHITQRIRCFAIMRSINLLEYYCTDIAWTTTFSVDAWSRCLPKVSAMVLITQLTTVSTLWRSNACMGQGSCKNKACSVSRLQLQKGDHTWLYFLTATCAQHKHQYEVLILLGGNFNV